MSSIIENNINLNLAELFPFSLDDFQLQAIAALDAGKSVVVCAPTGSGKTLVGEYAIYRALSQGRRVFYTTPLKALSNQKVRDFRTQFGADNVGLVTGDISFNRDAPILVMTTEIFRNMLYGTPIGQIGTSLAGVETVVLDECHYMNDQQRGTVWEESIIYCPKEIQLVALSATVANSENLTEWIARVHGTTELVYSNFRPVPLSFHFCNTKGLFPLLDEQNKLHHRLKKEKRSHPGERMPEPSLGFVISQLQARDMLPAIYFIFSRKGCERAVKEISFTDLSLVTPDETKKLRELITEFLEKNPELSRSQHLSPLYQGIASHHAGMLPAWKGLIEELFQQGLIKVVFATETLAAGINMPARTTIISSLSKRTDEGHRLLKASEFLQMSGRAGRRGMDLQGYVVTVQTRFEGAKEASHLATSKPDPLVSRFTPSYGMVLNLLEKHTLDEAKELVERSFGQFTSNASILPKLAIIDRIKEELGTVQEKLGIHSEEDLNALEKLLTSYEKLYSRLKEAKRLLKTLYKQAEQEQHKTIGIALNQAQIGTIVSLKGKHIPTARRSNSTPVSAILVAKLPGSGKSFHWLCLGKDNRWYMVMSMDVVNVPNNLPKINHIDQLSPPPEMVFKLGESRKGDELSQAIACQIPDVPELPEPAEITDQKNITNSIEQQLEKHPIHKWGNPKLLIKSWNRMIELDQEISDRQTELAQELARHWQQFTNLIAVLQTFSCLEESKPTVLGQGCAAIRGDNELWLGLALLSGYFDELDPHHLAAAAAALVTEISRPDSWTRYDVSEIVDNALGNLQGLRRQLFQVQKRHDVALPVWLERDLIGLVEQWALGLAWSELITNTSLDEGDVVRILRRTLDFLSQIPHVPHISNTLKANAYRAMQLIDRFPINEDVD